MHQQTLQSNTPITHQLIQSPPLQSYAPTVVHQPPTLQTDSRFVVPTFILTDDPIASHIAKECTAKKRVKDYEWFKDKMILAQAQEARVVLNDEQYDFLADSLEETHDCEDLQLPATANFKADHVDAYDSDCDDEAISNAIFMANLSRVSSINGDTVEPRYDSDILSLSVNTKLCIPPSLGTKLYSVTPLPKSKVIPKVVEKYDLSKSVTSHLTTNKIIKKCTKVLSPGLLKIESEPINVYFKNNRAVHRDYLKVTKEHVATLHELLEEARALKPLNGHIGHASKFAERIQELLVKNCNPNVKNVALSKNSANVCLSCNECLFSANHDACVVKYLKDVQKHKKAKNFKQKEKKQWKPTGRVFTLVGLRWKATGRMFNKEGKIIQTSPATIVPPGNRLHTIRIPVVAPKIVLWYLDSGCSKHMTGHRDKLINFISKFIGLDHNLFSVGHFCDSDLEVAFRKHTCFSRNLEGVDLLLESRGSNLYTISMVDMIKSSPIYNYSRFTWVKFLRMKDEALEIIIKFLKQAQVSLNATVRYLRIDNGTEFIDQTLKNYTKEVGITLTTSTARTPQQNDIVERHNPTACYTQNRTLIHTRYNKTPYELLRDRKPELKNLYVVSALCYPTNDFKDPGKLQPKADIIIFIGYSKSKKAASTSAKPPTKNDSDVLFQPMFDEYFIPPSVVSTPISVITLLPHDTARASPSSHSIDKEAPSLSISPNNETTSSPINSTNVEQPHNEEDAEFDSYTFTNPFASPDTSSVESSSRIVDTSKMHTFQQPQINTKRWIKDHPLVTIISNPSKPVLTRRQLATNALWCYFHAFLVKEEAKNYKEAMIESCWIEAMQEEIHEYERLEV
ncbi:integrase, catalytic region, zinc finger, CCHC-type containing protein [Tanacetum coccineum]